jgi:hypothetical protein
MAGEGQLVAKMARLEEQLVAKTAQEEQLLARMAKLDEQLEGITQHLRIKK